MENLDQNRPFGAFNPFANNAPNPFNRANRPTGANPQRRPNRATAHEADQEYARFQARAFGLSQAQPQERAAPRPVNGAIPPMPPAQAPQPGPAAPVAPGGPGAVPPPENGAPQAPPAPEQAANPPVILLGRNGNAGTGRELGVPPLIAIYNLGQELLGYLRTVAVAVEGSVGAVLVAVIEVGRPLMHFVTQWAAFLFFAGVAVWASLPTVVRALVALHRTVAEWLATLLEVLAWAFGVSIKWPRSALVSYTLRPEYMSRAVTGMAFLEPGVCPVGDGIRGPPYGATALSDADIAMFTLPFPLSLPPIRMAWSISWGLLVALVCTAIWAAGAALAIDLEIFPSEDDDGRNE